MRYFKIPLFIILFFALDACVGILLRPHFRSATLPAFQTFYANYVNSSAHSYDIVFIGDSRIQHGVDTEYISTMCECRAGNLALSGSTYPMLYYILQDYLETHTPKTVVLEMHWSRVAAQPGSSQNAFLLEMEPLRKQLDYFRTSGDLQFLAQKFIKSYEYRKALPRFLKGPSTLVQTQAGEGTSTDEFLPLSNAMSTSSVTSEIYRNLRVFDLPPDHTQIVYIEKIISLLRSKNINVILYQPPEPAEVSRQVTHYAELEAVITTEASKLKLPYVNLNDPEDPNLSQSGYFSDVLHLNSLGASLYTKKLWEGIKALLHTKGDTLASRAFLS